MLLLSSAWGFSPSFIWPYLSHSPTAHHHVVLHPTTLSNLKCFVTLSLSLSLLSSTAQKRWLFSVVNADPAFLTAPFPLPPQNKRRAIASYEAHNRNVRRAVPPARLLEYNVKQGWEPLCDFLEIASAECPAGRVPFPKSNSARAVRWQSYSAFVGPLLLSLLVGGCALRGAVRRVAAGRMRAVEWWRLRKRKESSLGSMTNGSKKRS
mmetsp:Transcript_12820/g.24474  ORF Transcript_12820/g.24474 Transcript_12820/m.24474 type:complete len:208 (+) Transcript_12820:1404-2027(+)